MKQETLPNICIIALPTITVENPGLQNVVNIFEDLVNNLYLITGIYTYPLPNPKTKLISVTTFRVSDSIIFRIYSEICMQLNLCYNLLKVINNIDLLVFYIGPTLIAPMIIAKLFNKKTILIASGSASESVKSSYGDKIYGSVLFLIIRALEFFNYRCSDKIVTYSQCNISQFKLDRYVSKIYSKGAFFIDTNFFSVKKRLNERKKVVGYVGRFGKEKGVLNFSKSIPFIFQERNDLEIIIAGDGPLLGDLLSDLKENGFIDKVQLAGWIPHEKLRDHLNELSLLVVPSYTEAMPLIVLESMSCGTPVLATPVGIIPDIIKDGETGFILNDNSPESIAEGVIAALSSPKLANIAFNSRNKIIEDYSYDAVTANYKKLLSSF